MADTWTSRLSEYLDEELGAGERAGVEAHLDACAECRATLDELRRVVARAETLTDAPPGADLWPAIAARIGGPLAAPPPLWRRRLSFTLPQALAAGLMLMLASAAGVWLLVSGNGVAPAGGPEPPPATVARASLADETYDHAVGDLEQVLAEGRDRLDPRTYAVIERNLRAIDRAIAESRRALEADPGNVYLNNHLATARQRKLSLLRRATALAHTEG